jgi:subfamily B ATP-binding cassette protein MsbA
MPKPGRLVRLGPRIRPFWPELSAAFVTLVLASAIGLAFPLIVRDLLDAAFLAKDRAQLDRIALGLLGLFLAQAALNLIQTYLLGATGERAIAGLRQELFAKLLTQPPGFFADRKTGELTSRLTSDIAQLQQAMSHQVAEIARQLLALVGGVIALTIMQPTLTLTALGVTPVVVAVAMLFGKRLKRATTGVQDRVAEATAVAEEAISQIRTVQSFTMEPAEVQRYADLNTAAVRSAIGRARTRGVFFGMITFVTMAAIVVVLWQGGVQVLAGALSGGELVAFLLYTVTIAAAVGTLASYFGQYQEAVGAAERVFELLELESPIADPPMPRAMPARVRGEVQFDDVTFRYPTGGTVLHGISLRVSEGETVALVGPSGAGKTTLVSLLPRFWDVTAGAVRLDGIDVRDLALADLRRSVGLVPQEPALFGGTVRENIGYGRPGASELEILAAARAANAMEFVEKLPQGLDTLVGERGVKLSGGQRQRLAIARAILKDPRVLILDEATSSLDTDNERLIEEALSTLLQERTTLIIAHRLSTVRRADRIVVLDRGRIVEEGSHQFLLDLGGLYARLYRQQFREEAAEPVA